MATFDDKSIFNKNSEESKDESVEEVEQEENIEETEELLDDEFESYSEELDQLYSAKVIGEEFVESEKARKLRLKNEKKEQRIQERQHSLMVKNHRKAMKKNPCTLPCVPVKTASAVRCSSKKTKQNSVTMTA